MRLINVVLLSFVILFVSCKKEVRKPDDLIPREKMKAILADLYIYRNLNELSLTKDKRMNVDEVNLAVLDKHNQTLEAFTASYKYYVIADAAYDEMLEEIKSEISQDNLILNKDTISQPEKIN